jgi:catechol 2,3-dioxygenase-like lactoylglutathione lyase family enzyme
VSVRAVDHVNIVTEHLEATRVFFQEVLGLEAGPRPPFAVTGYWLYAGERALVHIQVAKGPVRPSAEGALNHFALVATDFDGILEKVRARGQAPTVVTVPGTPVRQAFFLDPNGVRIEITEPTEAILPALTREGVSPSA